MFNARLPRRRWHNVPGTLTVELYRDTESFEVIRDTADDVALPEELQAWFEPRVKDDAELTIDFASSGYDDPGSMYGGPDQLGWPPEYLDERRVWRAVLRSGTGRMDVPPELLPTVGDWWNDEIEDAELDWPEPPENLQGGK